MNSHDQPFPTRVSGSHKRWGNAALRIELDGHVRWVVKDFTKTSRVFRMLMAKRLIRREVRACGRLRGLDGIPTECSLLHPLALRYRFIPGHTLFDVPKMGIPVEQGFFEALEELVENMHRRNVVHLDLRNARNVLITKEARPGLLDFQTALFCEHMPPPLRRLLINIDRSAVYKHWRRLCPETLDAGRAAWLHRFERLRPWWPFQGYTFQKWSRRGRKPRKARAKTGTGGAA